MVVVVHAVGQGDLGNDIVEMSPVERKKAQQELEAGLRELVGGGHGELLVDALFKTSGGGRFSLSPLSLILNALSPQPASGSCAPVKILLLSSDSGDRRTTTGSIADLMKNALSCNSVQEWVRQERRLEVAVEVVNANLFEVKGVDELRQRLEREDDPDVVVSGISGASMISMLAMGVVDSLGLRWRLAVTPEVGEEKAVLLERDSYADAPFYWLRSLGYVNEAYRWAKDNDNRLIDPGLGRMVDEVQRLYEKPEELDAGSLVNLVALDVARADNGAGILVRAWVKEHYKSLHKSETSSHDGDDLFAELTARSGKGREPELGKVIGEAQKRLASDPDGCPDSVRWLAEHSWLNEIGKNAVHDLAAPSFSQVDKVLGSNEVQGHLPDWVERPTGRPVLYIVPCGLFSRGDHVPARVLAERASPELRRAVPGAMLSEAPGLRVEFLLLHSADLRSKQTAIAAAISALTSTPDSTWTASGPIPVDIADYGGIEATEYVATPRIMSTVCQQVSLALEVKRPVAVIIVGTGQKGAVFGALKAAQEWCTRSAVPLFLQTFVDGKNGRSISQYHRIALHSHAEGALLRSAIAGMQSLNLLTTVRVLASGDREMNSFAERCDDLRKILLAAANDRDSPDAGVGVLLDLLALVAEKWEGVDSLTRMRLMVVVAESVGSQTRSGLLLRRNTNFGTSGHSYRRRLRSGAEAEMVTHDDLLQVIYEMRNRLVLAHGDKGPDEALHSVMVRPRDSYDGDIPFFVDAEGVTYPDLLRMIINRAREAALADGRTIPESSWKSDFTSLVEDMTKKLERCEGDTPSAPDDLNTANCQMRDDAYALVNLTPHEVVLDLCGGEVLRLPASGVVPRLVLSEGRQEVLRVADPACLENPRAVREVPVTVGASWLGLDPPLPDPRPNTLYVTSRVVAEHLPERTDLVWPDDLVRGADGQVVAARRLARPADSAHRADGIGGVGPADNADENDGAGTTGGASGAGSGRRLPEHEDRS